MGLEIKGEVKSGSKSATNRIAIVVIDYKIYKLIIFYMVFIRSHYV